MPYALESTWNVRQCVRLCWCTPGYRRGLSARLVTIQYDARNGSNERDSKGYLPIKT